ncbi:hypothetical protein GCM10028807_62240 [Spirosoma daeguense]
MYEKITCIAVDDEAWSLDFLLKHNLNKIPQLDLKGHFTNPLEALAFLNNNRVDLLFLDVEMPNYSLNGLDIMHRSTPSQAIIFISGMVTLALDYDFSAFNIIATLPKPFSFSRFQEAVETYQQHLSADSH